MCDIIVIEYLDWIEEEIKRAGENLQKKPVGHKEPYELGYKNAIENAWEKFQNIVSEHTEVKRVKT